MSATPTPLFVIGMNRSGTKWLSNLLASHPDVVAVQHEDHTGILETNAFFAWPAKFPDLSLVDEYAALVELWSATDFFRITGADKALFYGADPRPADPIGMFRLLMDDLARRRGRRFWLQKASPWSAEEIARRFPDARLVAIERDRMDTLRSTHYLETDGARPISLRTVASHRLQERLLEGARRRGAVSVRFESLKARPEEELARVCRELGLPFDAAMLEVRWGRNTSFRDEQARRFEFSEAERRKIRLLLGALALVPDGLLRAAWRAFGTRDAPVVGGTFRQVRRERGLP